MKDRQHYADEIPETQIEFQFKKDGIKIKQKVNWRKKEVNQLRKSERKPWHSRKYIAALHTVNKFYGRPSEWLDTIEALTDGLVIDGELIAPRMSLSRRLHELWLAVMDGRDWHLDLDLALTSVLNEHLSDKLIGSLSNAEKRVLLEKLGPRHPLVNMLGLPTTWLRRMNVDVFDLPMSVWKAAGDTVMRLMAHNPDWVAEFKKLRKEET